jgi:hypothetical protein
VDACRDKDVEAKTFSRKDHLKQHLKTVHHVTYWRSVFNTWRRDRDLPSESRCGFCGQEFTDWRERNDHLIGHYAAGTDMDTWRGDWVYRGSEWSNLVALRYRL